MTRVTAQVRLQLSKHTFIAAALHAQLGLPPSTMQRSLHFPSCQQLKVSMGQDLLQFMWAHQPR